MIESSKLFLKVFQSVVWVFIMKKLHINGYGAF